jgi:presqualene diphosphate synthase
MSSAMAIDETAPEIRAVQQKASGSSFYAAMRLMPKQEREAMFAIYAFCRAVDDIADDGIGTRPERHDALTAWRRDIDALYAGSPAGRAAFLKKAVDVYGLRKDDFLTVIDGMDMDVAEDIRAPSLAVLELYCDRVASAVGRLSVKVFGMEEEPGFVLAHHLGRALQLTNILRDIDEDARIDRLYLPSEYLSQAGIETDDPATAISVPAIDRACRKVALLAHEHYREAKRVMATRPKGRIRTPKLMCAVYSQILSEMEKTGWQPPRHRVSLGKWRLLGIVIADGLLA